LERGKKKKGIARGSEKNPLKKEDIWGSMADDLSDMPRVDRKKLTRKPLNRETKAD